MNLRQKLFFTLAGILSLISAGNANAQFDGRAVLYKVHDIRPVKDHESQIIACEFDATIYNRTDMNLAAVTMDVSWKDDVVESTIELEKKEAIKSSDTNSFSRNRSLSKTESLVSKGVGTQLALPPLASYKQITVTGRVDTDRCFLLIEEPSLNIKSCKASSASKDNKASDLKEGDCKDMFKFISPTNPEYYSEFKSASYQEQQREENQQKQKEKNELNTIYNKAVSSLNRVSETLDAMK